VNVENFDVEEEMTVKYSSTLPLYNFKQNETIDDVIHSNSIISGTTGTGQNAAD